MSRPKFLDRPSLWTRTPRTDQTPADYACACDIPTPHRFGWVNWSMLIMAAAVLLAIYFGVL